MKRFLAIFLAVVLLLSSFPIGSLKAYTGTEPQEEGQLATPVTRPRANDDEVVSNEWSTGNFPLMQNYSGQTPNATGSTGLKYKGTYRDNYGEYINIEVTQVGKVYDVDKYSAGNLRNAVGWSHLVLHFDQVLFGTLILISHLLKDLRILSTLVLELRAMTTNTKQMITQYQFQCLLYLLILIHLKKIKEQPLNYI